MDVLSTFYPDLHTTNNIVPKIISYAFFFHGYTQNSKKPDPVAIKCATVTSPMTQKGNKCYYPLSRFFFYRGSTFSEEELYFTNPIFKGQIQQDNDLFLLDLSIQPFLNLCILPLLTFYLRKPRKILSGDGCPWA